MRVVFTFLMSRAKQAVTAASVYRAPVSNSPNMAAKRLAGGSMFRWKWGRTLLAVLEKLLLPYFHGTLRPSVSHCVASPAPHKCLP